MIYIKNLENILTTVVYIVIFLCVPLAVCFGLYITKNPWCLLALAFCYGCGTKRNKDKNSNNENTELKMEEE